MVTDILMHAQVLVKLLNLVRIIIPLVVLLVASKPRADTGSPKNILSPQLRILLTL